MTSKPHSPTPSVHILGTHGVPANYGGFETAAQHIGLHLRRSGWNVAVYGQEINGRALKVDRWEDLVRITIGVRDRGWLTTAVFDLKSILHSTRHRPDVVLTFGYNTGIFNIVQRLLKIPNVINMDGLEWTRSRHGRVRQAILWFNEKAAASFGNLLIGDHPEITKYLEHIASTRKLSTIAYGADPIDELARPWPAKWVPVGQPYMIMIARLIPENSIAELIRSYSKRPRTFDLVVLGDLQPDVNAYHRHIQDSASSGVRFVGAIYDPFDVESLRVHAEAYLHGHTVGGTNPSLVEAMAAGNAVIAHDNRFNRWVVDKGALYFRSEVDADEAMTELERNNALRDGLARESRRRFNENFTWNEIGEAYRLLLTRAITPH